MANGIPSLLTSVGQASSTIGLLVSDFSQLFSPSSFHWGIFTPGTPTPPSTPNLSLTGISGTLSQAAANVPSVVSSTISNAVSSVLGTTTTPSTTALIPDTILSVEYKNSSHVMDYPIQQGNFAQYNKVQMPYQAKVTMAIGQTQTARQTFLNNLDAMAQSLNLYNVVTPERTFSNANIIDYSYTRTISKGAYMLVVEVSLEEIRTSAMATFAPLSANDITPASQGQLNPGPNSAAAVFASSTNANALGSGTYPLTGLPSISY